MSGVNQINRIDGVNQGWANYSPWTACNPREILLHLVRPDEPPEEKLIWMNTMSTFARVVGVANDKNHNSFLARVGKRLPTTGVNESNLSSLKDSIHYVLQHLMHG